MTSSSNAFAALQKQSSSNGDHASIVANGNSNTLMTLTTQLLNQYGAAKST
jgi:hypothetical protein